MTTIELIQTVQDMVSEDSYIRFPKLEIIRWLNRGLEDIANKTGYLTWKWLLITEADIREYAYPDDALRIFRVEYANAVLPICDIPVLDAATDEGLWLAETGAPTNWYHAWAHSIGIYPLPDAVYSMHALGFHKKALLADDDSEPLIPDQFHRAVALFAAFNIKRADGDLTTMGSLRNEYHNPITKTGIIQDMIDERTEIEKGATGTKVGYSRSTLEEG